MNVGALVVTVVLLVLNGLFVAVEFALVGSRRSKLQALADAGDRRAAAGLRAASDLNLQLAGAQLGITLASLALGYIAEPAIVDGLVHLTGPIDIPDGVRHTVAFVIGLGIVSFLHLVVGEMVPKNVALANPERTLLWLARLNEGYLRLFRPVVHLLNRAANIVIRKVFRVEPKDELGEARTAEEFAVMLAESHEEGAIEDFAHGLLSGVLDFGGRDAAAVMVPRDEVAWVSASTSVEDIERMVVERGHSRLLVTGVGGIDNYLGFVHSKDLLTVPDQDRGRRLPPSVVRRLLKTGRHWSLEDVLLRMRQARVHVAVVLEEDETVAGILTLEDLLEELVGDILDETDADAPDGAPDPGSERGDDRG